MALGIHKPGQGYWVRVMTATIIGLVTVALAAWSWDQTSLIVERLPKSKHTMRVDRFVDAQGKVVDNATLAAGQSVTLLGKAVEGQSAPTLGKGQVVNFDVAERIATVGAIEYSGAATDPAGTAQLVVGDPASPQIVARIQDKSVSSLPPVEPVLVKGIVASVVILLGTVLAWYFAASRVKTVEFLIATDFEMKKVNWSTPREVVGSTWVVVIVSVFLATTLFFFDTILQFFFRLIDVLHIQT
jgi:preprotein translocase SecE subunit